MLLFLLQESISTTLSDGTKVDVIIRYAMKSDLPMVWENFNEVVQERIFIPVISEVSNKYEQESWFYNHQSENNVVLIAEIGGKVIGHCTIEHNNWECSEQVGELGILLNKQYRHARPSIGKILVKIAIREAKLKGFKKITLSVFHTNTNAIKMYKKIGFTIVGTRKKQFQIDNNCYDEMLMDYFIE